MGKLISPEMAANRSIRKICIDEHFACLRGLSPKRLRFGIEYSLERGSTSNSFLLFNRSKSKSELSKAILIHPPGANFKEVFLEALNDEIPTDIAELIVIVGHVNPNRVTLLKELASAYPFLKIVCSSPGGKLLREIWNQEKPDPNSKVDIKKESKAISPIPTIEVVKEKGIIFSNHEIELLAIPAPNGRWPGELMIFEKNSGVLMSDKFFGTHICTQSWAEITSNTNEEERRHYFDCLMAPMNNQVDSIIESIEDLDIKTIAPTHGPAIEGSWKNLVYNYRRWGESHNKASLKVVLLFASAYGNTAAIADALGRGVNKAGVRVESINCEFTPASQIIEAIQSADGYLIGSPTIGGHAPTPIISTLGSLLAEGNRKKPIGIFGSYGWSGEALDLLENKLRDGGFEFGFKPIKIKFTPNSQKIKELEEIGTHFSRDILKNQRKEKRKASGRLRASKENPALIALGRVVGSLCVLSAQKGRNEERIRSAMIASWVSQASFTPPGITVAVAKDRAVENLLHIGDYFTLNIIGEEEQQYFLGKFLKPFVPGQDRLSDITIEESPMEQPIFPEALAWIECSVSQRMDCGDHWIIYAEVQSGKVLNQKGITAVHHRQSGGSY